MRTSTFARLVFGFLVLLFLSIALFGCVKQPSVSETSDTTAVNPESLSNLKSGDKLWLGRNAQVVKRPDGTLDIITIHTKETIVQGKVKIKNSGNVDSHDKDKSKVKDNSKVKTVTKIITKTQPIPFWIWILIAATVLYNILPIRKILSSIPFLGFLNKI